MLFHRPSPWQKQRLNKGEMRIPMQAYIVDQPGGNFRKSDLPIPALKPNQVLVSVKASGVNPLDIKIRAGKAPHAKQPLPSVLGVDMAGVVEEVGPTVTGFRCGDEV